MNGIGPELTAIVNSNQSLTLDARLKKFRATFDSYEFKPSDTVYWETNNEEVVVHTEDSNFIFPFILKFNIPGVIRVFVNIKTSTEDAEASFDILVNGISVKSLYSFETVYTSKYADITVNAGDEMSFRVRRSRLCKRFVQENSIVIGAEQVAIPKNQRFIEGVTV